MPSLVSIAGIDEALANLSLKPDSQKAKLIAAIRQNFVDQDDLQAIKEIPVDALLAAIWEDADPTALKARRKSFSSLKSALNKSLKDLAAQGLNPEGIIISRANVFEVSDEQKSVLLEKLGGGGHLDSRLAEMFATFKKVFPEIAQGHGGEGMSDLLQALEQAKGLIAELDEALKEKDGQIAALQEKISDLAAGQEVGHLGGKGGLGGPETTEEVAPHIAAEEVEEIAIDDRLDSAALDEDIQEIADEEVEEVEIGGENVEEVEVDDSLDAASLAEDTQEIGDEDVEEVEVDDGLDDASLGEDTQEIGGEDVEEVEVDDSLDAASLDEDIQEISGEEVEEVEVDDSLDNASLGEDMQEIDGEEIEEVEVDDGLDDASLGEGTQEIDGEEVEEVEVDDGLDNASLDEDIQEIDGEEVEEVEVDDGLDTTSLGEGTQEIDGEEVEEVEVDDSLDDAALGEDIQEIDGEEVEEVEVDDGLDNASLAEDIQEISDEEVEEVEVDDGLDNASLGEDIQEISDEEVEEVEVDDGLDTAALAEDIQEIDGEEFEEVEIDEAGEISEILDEADQTGVPQSKLLEVLSKYLEPEEALQGRAETLTESEEGLVSQLLERFTPKFIKIPAGRYPFGCANPSPDEHPLQTVVAQEFFLGQYPVTNDLFELFVRETGYETDAEKFGHGLVCEGHWRARKDPTTGRASFTITPMAAARQVNGANWRHPSGPGCLLAHRHNHPVVQISRRDAQAFAAWAGKRLPTEEEWEIAARGADGRLFPWGHEWHAENGNFSASCLGDTTPVERYQDRGRSPFGIADLLGNVYEWTASLPQPGNSGRIILKGGCWNSRGMISVCHRKIETETWSNLIGFRLAV